MTVRHVGCEHAGPARKTSDIAWAAARRGNDTGSGIETGGHKGGAVLVQQFTVGAAGYAAFRQTSALCNSKQMAGA